MFEFQVYHLHVPLLKIELVENLQLNRGQNAWHLAAQSIPEYTEELLSLVSHLSEGTMKTYITIKDVAFRGNVGMWGEIFRGKEFPIVIPPLDGELIANINAKI